MTTKRYGVIYKSKHGRELMELAAKALGCEWRWYCAEVGQLFQIKIGDLWIFWNPLVNGDDALDLAHKLKIDIFIKDSYSCCGIPGSDDYVFVEDSSLQGVYKAITMAAAEIGRNMK